MKKKLVSCLVLFAVLLSAVNLCYSAAAAVQLTDIDGHWAYTDIRRAVDAGYIKGYPDSTFKPDKTVTRAEYITMLNSVFNVPMEGTDTGFRDVKSGDWYAKDVWAAIKAGYADIFRGDSFKPNQPLTRQEAATLTANLSGIVSDGESKSFNDNNKIADWAKNQVSAMARAGIINGYPDGSFRPEGLITRAEAVSIINRAKLYSDSTRVDKYLTVTGSVVNVRSGPDTSYSVITKVNRGQILKAQMLSSNNWYKVSFDGISGWIIGDYVADNYSGGSVIGDSGTGGKNPSRGGNVDRGESPDTGTGNEQGKESGTGSNQQQNPQNPPRDGESNAGEGGAKGGTGAGDGTSVIDPEGGEDGAGSNPGDDSSGGNPNAGGVWYPGNGDKPGKKLVVVDAGHGGHDPGAVGLNGTKEKDINLEIALRLAALLSEAGYDVILTRADDTFIPLKDRSIIANNAKADIFVSIHCNATVNHDATGTSVYTQSETPPGVYPNQEESRRLASNIHKELLRSLGLNDAGIRRKNLSVCRETNAPTVLIEVAFIDNKIEEILLNIPEFQQAAAKAILKGIENYFAGGM